MSFQAFFDDSGTGIPVFVLSGFVSPVYWWEDFSKEWQQLLDEPPKLDYFKMREAAQLCDQFGGMKAEQRNERIYKFFCLIKRAVHLSYSCVVPIGPFKRIWKGKVTGPKEWNDPHYVALWDAMTFLIQQHFHFRLIEAFARKGDNSPSAYGTLDFIFDSHARLAAIVPPYYQTIRSSMHPLLSGWIGAAPRFEDDKDFLPLQACDAQSWYFRRLFAEKFSNQPFKSDLPKSVFSPFDEIHSAMSFWSSERMRQTIEQLNNPPQDKHGRSLLEAPPVGRRFDSISDLIANADLT